MSSLRKDTREASLTSGCPVHSGSPFPGEQCRKRCSLETCALGKGEGTVAP